MRQHFVKKSKSLFISLVGYIRKVYNNKDVSKTTGCTITKIYRVHKITYARLRCRKTSTNITQEGAWSGVWNDSVVVIGCSDEESRCDTHLAKLPFASPRVGKVVAESTRRPTCVSDSSTKTEERITPVPQVVEFWYTWQYGTSSSIEYTSVYPSPNTLRQHIVIEGH